MSRTIHSSAIFMVCAVFWLRLLDGAPVERASSHPITSKASNKVPQVLLDIYDCWNSGSQDCLPIADSEVNAVHTILGHVDESPPQAAQSFNQDTELTDSVAITFNSSTITGEVVHAAVLRVPKHALTEEQIKDLESQCDLSDLKVHLYSTLSLPKNPKDVVVLEKSIQLAQAMLGKEEWLSFTNVTEPLKEGLSSITLRLAIGGDCSSLAPTEFGFGREKPELVAYMKSEVKDSVLTEIVNEQRRKRRQASTGSGDPDKQVPTQPPMTTEPGLPETTEPNEPLSIEYYTAPRCQLFDFIVDFDEIGFGQYLLRPSIYNARICSGHCEWPLDNDQNYTRHSFIQSLVNVHDRLVPPPCCAPKPGTLGRIAVVIRESEDIYTTRWWVDMVATACGCL